MLLEIARMAIILVPVLRTICLIAILLGLIGLTVLLLASPLLTVAPATPTATLLILLALSLLLGLRVTLLLGPLLQRRGELFQ
jgi:hypothetical protein